MLLYSNFLIGDQGWPTNPNVVFDLRSNVERVLFDSEYSVSASKLKKKSILYEYLISIILFQ